MNQRYYGIDYLKIIATLFVISFHCGMIVDVTVPLMTVMVFFISSGYLYKPRDNDRFKRSIVGLVGITVVYTIIYMVINGYTYGRYDLITMLNGLNIFELILTNENAVYAHLWFMGSYIYVLIIAHYGLNHLSSRQKNILMISLWLIGSCLPLVFPSLPLQATRNFLFFGLGCFVLGQWIHDHPSLIEYSWIKLILGLIISTAMVAINIYLIPNGQIHFALFFTEPFFYIILFAIAIKASKSLKRNRLLTMYSKGALHIYLIHPLIYLVINSIMLRFSNPISLPLAYCRAIGTIIVSFIVGYGINSTVSIVKRRC